MAAQLDIATMYVPKLVEAAHEGTVAMLWNEQC